MKNFRRCTLVLTVAFLALSLLFARRASADNTADEADLQFKLGADAYQKSDFSSALEHFLASNRLVPNRNVVFDIARSYEELKNAPAAYRYYVEAQEGETRADQLQRINEALKRIAPNVAVLKVVTDPPGAAVYLDRKDLGSRGNTPRNLGLGAGKHKVIVELAGYESAEQENVDLVIGKEADVSFKLVAILGTVRVDGEEGATVKIDSEDSPVVCTIPCTTQIKPGHHTLIVQKPGYQNDDVPVDVPARGSTAARAHLSAQTGAVVVNTDIRDALITIDDQPSGFSPAVLNVPIGQHKIRVSLSGFRPIEQRILVTKQGQVKLDLQFTTLEEVSAASRYTESVDDAPASVTVISNQELRAMNYPTIAEAVRGVRGIYLSNDTSYDTIGVRGFSRPGDYGNRILILIDGHPANDDYIWSSYVGFDGRTDLDDIERIEIIRGPGSVLYGTSAFFGVINLVTRGRDQPTHTEVGAAAVQTNVGRGRATEYYRINKDAGAWISVAGAHGAGQDYYFPELNDSGSATPRLDAYGHPYDGNARGVDGFSSTTVNGRFWWKDFTVQWFLTSRKKTLPATEYGTVLNDPNTHFTDTRGFVEAKYEPHLSSTTQLFTRAHVDMYDFDGYSAYVSPKIDPTSTGPELDTYRGRWTGLEARVQYSIDKLRLMAGGEGIYHFQTLQEGDTMTQPVVFDNNGNPGRNDPFAVAAGYVNADIVPTEKVKISAGARLDYYSSIATFNFLDSFNPRLALIFKPTKDDVIKVMTGKAFRAPSVYELYYQSTTQLRSGVGAAELTPEQILSGEIEYSHHFTSTVTGLVTGYVNYVSNLIELNDIQNGAKQQYQNSSNPVFVLGGETEVRREWRQGWMLSVSGTISRAGYATGGCIGLVKACTQKNDDGSSTYLGQVPNSPLVLGSLKGAMPIIGRQLMLMTRMSFEGPRFDNAIAAQTGAAQGTTDPGLIWDLVFSGEVESLGVRYAVGAYNVMNWQYQAVPSVEFPERVIPQAGRTFLASLTKTF
jgi:outer membrane receptor protein involved in Fe transport